MRLKAILFWILAAISIVASSQSIKAETTKIKLKVEKLPKVCSNDTDKEFIVIVEMGKVVKTDSLFGFDFQLIYDSKNVQLTDFLTVGCLAEKCTHKNASFNGDTVHGYATRLDFYALAGDKPLFAFKGKVRDDCIDSALIKIDYIEFTQEYTKDVEIDSVFFIKVDRIENNSNQISAKFDKDTLSINDDEQDYSQEMTISYNGIKLIDNAEIKVSANQVNNLLNFELPNGYTIQNIDENNVILKYSVNPTYAFTNKVTLKLNKEYLLAQDNPNIMINVDFVHNNCMCIGRYSGDTLTVIKSKSGVLEEIEPASSFHVENILRVGSQYSYAKLYDTTGKLLFDGKITDGKIDLSIYENGFYLAVMYDENRKIIKRIKVIKYLFFN